MPRRSYHSDLKLAVQTGLVPIAFEKAIPRSTLSRFRNSDYSSLYGTELSDFFANLDLLKEIAASKSALKAASVVLRIASFSRRIGIVLGKFNTVRMPEMKERIVAFVTRIEKSLPRPRILAILGLSAGRFRSWSRKKYHCPSSPLDRCRKSHPNQLSRSELIEIRKAFRDQSVSAWPASSVAWRLIHEERVSASPATIVEYAKRLGLRGTEHIHRSRKRGSLVTSRPNEAWHLDATVLFTESHERLYLQLIIDNFSRRILSWDIAPSISGERTKGLIKKAFASIGSCSPDQIDLIVDGGSENNNRTVSAFLEETPIRKFIAKVDVIFSNSMIEAVNKILKYQYIFRSPIPDAEHAPIIVGRSIHLYNDRPHYALSGLTPNQTYDGILFDKDAYRDRLLKGRTRRLEENRNSCNPCVPFDLESEA